MTLKKGSDIVYVPASHEDQDDPGVWKKILFRKEELRQGHIQMINWAKLPVGKEFQKHYHEDMEEVFILLSGTVEVGVGNEVSRLNSGDSVLVPIGSTHRMKNIGNIDAEYIVIGNATGTDGKTVV